MATEQETFPIEYSRRRNLPDPRWRLRVKINLGLEKQEVTHTLGLGLLFMRTRLRPASRVRVTSLVC